MDSDKQTAYQYCRRASALRSAGLEKKVLIHTVKIFIYSKIKYYFNGCSINQQHLNCSVVEAGFM